MRRQIVNIYLDSDVFPKLKTIKDVEYLLSKRYVIENGDLDYVKECYEEYEELPEDLFLSKESESFISDDTYDALSEEELKELLFLLSKEDNVLVIEEQHYVVKEILNIMSDDVTMSAVKDILADKYATHLCSEAVSTFIRDLGKLKSADIPVSIYKQVSESLDLLLMGETIYSDAFCRCIHYNDESSNGGHLEFKFGLSLCKGVFKLVSVLEWSH